jgi:hypothetical protein
LKKDVCEINFPNGICAGHDFNKFSSHRCFEVHGVACLLGKYISDRFVFKANVAGLVLILGEFWVVWLSPGKFIIIWFCAEAIDNVGE